MDFPIRNIPTKEASANLVEIPNPPLEVSVRGELAPRGTKCLAVVGSRNYSDYGKRVVEYLIGGLRGYPISIISGLALGIDTLAHEAALSAGLHTLSVPGSGLDDSVIYPSRNKSLARKILENGGGLLSEFEPTLHAAQWTFPKRNRIMAGLADAVLLIEATEKSGTLITARLTADFNRELLVVPGSIFSESSKGTHQFLKLGATPVTSPEDILDIFGLTPTDTPTLFNTSFSDEELTVLAILSEPKDHDTIIRLLPYPSNESLTLLMKMELAGHIQESNGMFIKIV